MVVVAAAVAKGMDACLVRLTTWARNLIEKILVFFFSVSPLSNVCVDFRQISNRTRVV